MYVNTSTEVKEGCRSTVTGTWNYRLRVIYTSAPGVPAADVQGSQRIARQQEYLKTLARHFVYRRNRNRGRIILYLQLNSLGTTSPVSGAMACRGNVRTRRGFGCKLRYRLGGRVLAIHGS